MVWRSDKFPTSSIGRGKAPESMYQSNHLRGYKPIQAGVPFEVGTLPISRFQFLPRGFARLGNRNVQVAARGNPL